MFERLIKTFRGYFPEIDRLDITKRVKAMFRQGFGNPLDVFPKETYTYGKQVGNDVNLVVEHEESIFR